MTVRELTMHDCATLSPKRQRGPSLTLRAKVRPIRAR
jgi:hypothetical protein